MKVIMPNKKQQYYKVIDGTLEAYVYYNHNNKYSVFDIRMSNNYSINRDGDIFIRDDDWANGWTHIDPGEIKIVFAIRDAYNTAKLKRTEWYDECETDTLYLDTILCPYCGEDCMDEYATSWVECPNCGKEFRCYFNVTTTYATSKMEEVDGTA